MRGGMEPADLSRGSGPGEPSFSALSSVDQTAAAVRVSSLGGSFAGMIMAGPGPPPSSPVLGSKAASCRCPVDAPPSSSDYSDAA